MSQLFASGSQRLELQLQSFQWIFMVDFLQDWLVCSPCCLRDPQESSAAPQFKSIMDQSFIINVKEKNTKKKEFLRDWLQGSGVRLTVDANERKESGATSTRKISITISSVTQSYPILCNPMDCSTPVSSVHHQIPEFTQTHVHWVGDAIQPSHPLSSPSPPAFNHSQHQGLFKWVSSLLQVAKVLGGSALASVLPINIQDWFTF